jgi:hypothetical protein
LLTGCPPAEESSDEPSDAIDEGRRTDEAGIVIQGPILGTEDKDNNKSIKEICERGVECPEGFDSTTAASTGVECDVCGGDLGC